jgi:hypothetical protein
MWFNFFLIFTVQLLHVIFLNWIYFFHWSNKTLSTL